MDWLADPQIWISLLSLTALEVVLGIDNLIFIAILANKLPEQQRDRARKLGLALALFMRLTLLASISWLVGLTEPLFSMVGQAFSWRSLLLIGGGLFLVYKGTSEIHARVEGGHEPVDTTAGARVTFVGVITQIILLDVVFSLDSVITAIGMVDQLWVMATAVVISVGLMLAVSGPLAAFVLRHPTVKMLALSFLLMIGMVLVADGFDVHVPKGYVYAAMGFSVAVECLNLLVSSRRRAADTLSRSGSSEDRFWTIKSFLETSMAKDFLGDRKVGLEEAFFAEQDAILRRRLGEADEKQRQREALAAASGINDTSVLDKLLAQNVNSATIEAWSLLPLVIMAWADRRLDESERASVLSGAEQAGLDRQHSSYHLLEGWLTRKPSAELVATWREYVSARSATLTHDARQALKSELLDRARVIAEAAGGFMGIGKRVSAVEAAVLVELEQAFAVTSSADALTVAEH